MAFFFSDEYYNTANDWYFTYVIITFIYLFIYLFIDLFINRFVQIHGIVNDSLRS